MKQSTEVDFCKNFFYTSGRKSVVELIDNSNLTNRERELVNLRYIEGLRVKEICNRLNMDEFVYKKEHRRILGKLYVWMFTNLAASLPSM